MKRSASKQDLSRIEIDNSIDLVKKTIKNKSVKPLSKENIPVLSKKADKNTDITKGNSSKLTETLKQDIKGKQKKTRDQFVKVEIPEIIIEKIKRKRWITPDVWPNGSKITCIVNDISIETGRIIRDNSGWKALTLENKVYYDFGTADSWANALALLPENEEQDIIKTVKKKKAPR